MSNTIDILEYIESNGSQYIDTGIKASNNIKIIIDFENLYTSTSTHIFGSRITAGDDSINLAYMNETWSNGWHFGWGDETQQSTDTDINRRQYIMEDAKAYIDDTLVHTFTNQTFNNSYNIYIFTCNNGGTPHTQYSSIKLFSCKIYDNNILVRDLVPAKTSDGIICLFDKITNTLFLNKGAGNFSAGEVTGNIIIPSRKKIYVGANDNLEIIDYIESNGTQFINTGLSLPEGYKAEVEFIATNTSSTYMGLIGCEDRTTPYNRNFLMLHTDKDWSLGAYGNYRNSTWDTDIRYNAKFSTVKGDCYLYVNDSLITSNTDSDERSSNTIYMFACGSDNNTALYFGSLRMFRAKIYSKNDELLRDFIPVKTDTGLFCMYDMVTNKKFESANEIKFTGGYINTELEYIEANSTQYIDTGVKNTSNTRIVCCMSFPTGHSFYNGSEIGGTNGRFKWGLNGSSTTLGIGWGSNFYNYTTIAPDSGRNYHIFDLKHGSQIIKLEDGTELAKYTDTTLTKYATYNIYLFRLMIEGTLENQNGSARMKYCQIYQGNLLVRDFIPFINENGVVCLYDKVNSQYYYRKGTGTFSGKDNIQGSNLIERKNIARQVKKLYSGESQELRILNYARCTNYQYIDTGIKATNNTKVEIKISHYDSNYGAVFGTYEPNKNKNFTIFAGSLASNQRFNGSTISRAAGYWASGTDYTIVQDKNGQSVNGVLTSYDATPSDFISDSTLYIGNINNSTNSFNGKIYYCKIWENETLVGDFVPVFNELGIIYFYDKVTSKLFSNSGTGKFMSGGVSNETINKNNIARRIIFGYVGINGIARKFYSKEKSLNYYGRLTDLRKCGEYHAVTTTPDFIVVGGGKTDGVLSNLTEWYSKNLVKMDSSGFTTARMLAGATSINGNALFAGGVTIPTGSWSNHTTAVDAYTNELLHKTPTSLSTSAFGVVGASNPKYALFAGGSTYSSKTSTVNAYNIYLTKSNPTALNNAKSLHAGGSINNYAIFAGGQGTSSTNLNDVNAYDTSLTKTSLATLPTNKCAIATASVGNYLLFAGGSSSGDHSANATNTVYAYSSSLVLSTITALTHARTGAYGVSLNNDYAIIWGGYNNGYVYPVEVYDKNLVKSIPFSIDFAFFEWSGVHNSKSVSLPDVSFLTANNIVAAIQLL